MPAWSAGWERGYGKDYAGNHPHQSEEYDELFPMPKYWLFDESKSKYQSHPLLAYFWREDGMPKYPKGTGEAKVNDFITLEEVDVFKSDLLCFRSVEHALLLSKYSHFAKCGLEESFRSLENGFELSDEEEKTWDIFKYSVCLNATYFRVMEKDELKRKLLETGDRYLFYESDDEWGGEENLFGRALMEVRDEIIRICRNEDLIDWQYSEYLKIES